MSSYGFDSLCGSSVVALTVLKAVPLNHVPFSLQGCQIFGGQGVARAVSWINGSGNNPGPSRLRLEFLGATQVILGAEGKVTPFRSEVLARSRHQVRIPHVAYTAR